MSLRTCVVVKQMQSNPITWQAVRHIDGGELISLVVVGGGSLFLWTHGSCVATYCPHGLTLFFSEIGTLDSIEFHGTARFIEIGTLQVPWISIKFQGTARGIEIGKPQIPWNSMELLVPSKFAHSNFYGIPWNSMKLLVAAKFAHFNSTEFHGIPWNCS